MRRTTARRQVLECSRSDVGGERQRLAPFWLPKMLLDGVEGTEREKLKKLWETSSGSLNWGDHNRIFGDYGRL